MTNLWCWRCKTEMPMLDEDEYADISALYRAAFNLSIPQAERFSAMLGRYEEITGYKETNPNAVMHHRLSLYGPPCRNCGRPLRTPNAKLCGSCMAPRG